MRIHLKKAAAEKAAAEKMAVGEAADEKVGWLLMEAFIVILILAVCTCFCYFRSLIVQFQLFLYTVRSLFVHFSCIVHTFRALSVHCPCTLQFWGAERGAKTPMGLPSPFGHRFGATFLLRFGLIWKIPRHVWYFLAQNFVAHLSGWAGSKMGLRCGHFLAPSLRNGDQVGKLGNMLEEK